MPNKVSTRGRVRAAAAEPTSVSAVNEIRLVGRVAGVPISRELPSGDVVTMLRVVVERPSQARRERAPTSDTLDCAVWTARLRHRADSLAPGTVVEVEGALRRRFWRTAGGPVSRYEVEVTKLRRLGQPGGAVASR